MLTSAQAEQAAIITERAGRATVLVVTPYYLPAVRSGGPVQSLSNMVAHLGHEFHFKVVTRDREFDDAAPYPGIRAGEWHGVGKADVCYLSSPELSLAGWRRLLMETEYDLLYLNSFFSPHFTLKPLLLRRVGSLPRVPVIVAPRGEFSPGALAIRSHKKRSFIALARAIGLYQGVLWHSCHEEHDIRRCFGNRVRVLGAPFLFPAERSSTVEDDDVSKVPGQLSVAFLSRISPKKNLDGALRMLQGVHGDVQLNIYGPIDDPPYWSECRRLIRALPLNVRVAVHGNVDHARVAEVLRQNHLFLLPTLGDNFGRVILEAMLAGCPALISDQTPWRGLAALDAGWDLPLDRIDLFRRAIQECVAMDAATHRARSRRAREYALRQTDNAAGIDRHRLLFRTALVQRRCSVPSARCSAGEEQTCSLWAEHRIPSTERRSEATWEELL